MCLHIHKTLNAPNQLGASLSVELRGVLPKSKTKIICLQFEAGANLLLVLFSCYSLQRLPLMWGWGVLVSLCLLWCLKSLWGSFALGFLWLPLVLSWSRLIITHLEQRGNPKVSQHFWDSGSLSYDVWWDQAAKHQQDHQKKRKSGTPES